MNNSALQSNLVKQNSENKNDPIFRFLTANQVLQLTKIEARQVLLVAPQVRNVSKHKQGDTSADGDDDDDDDALAFVFVSHRWTDPGDPDSDGSQLRTLQKWLRYVDELLQATAVQKGASLASSSWPEDLKDLVEGMPQAAALVSRILANHSVSDDEKRSNKKLYDNPLDHIYIWYDCACLPQKFPNGRTHEEKHEFGLALQNLDQLAQQCEVVVLRSEDYFSRAWCAFEHLQKALDQYEGHIFMDCQKVLNETRVDWQLSGDVEEQAEKTSGEGDSARGNDTDSKNAADSAIQTVLKATQEGDVEAEATTMQQLMQAKKTQGEDLQERARRTMLNSQRIEFDGNQTMWKGMHQSVSKACERHDQTGSQQQQQQPKEEEEKKDDQEDKPTQDTGGNMVGKEEQTKPASKQQRPNSSLLGRLFPGCYPDKHGHGAIADALPPPPATPTAKQQDSAAMAPLSAPSQQPKKQDSTKVRINVPDLCKAQHRIRNATITPPPPPPLVEAMTYLIRELYTAVFAMSCRDAAGFAQQGRERIIIPPNLNECIPNVGLQCGLHDHRQARPLEEQSQALLSCIAMGHKASQLQFGRLHCPNGHRLQPGITSIGLNCDGKVCQEKQWTIDPGQVHAGCMTCNYDVCFFCATGQVRGDESTKGLDPSSQESLEKVIKVCHAVEPPKSGEADSDTALCERKVTVDLFQLAKSILSRFGLACTNSGDVAFVGLLALRNILSSSNDRAATKNRVLTISAGSLRFLSKVLDQAVLLYSSMLAFEREVTSLAVTISINVPRWVLLDMACAKLDVNTHLAVEGSFDLGKKVQEYFTEHPDCISFSFDTGERPLTHRFCQQDSNCHGGWAPCQHEMQKSILSVVSSVAKSSASLDAWFTMEFPTILACFVSLCVSDHVYVLGGANGDEDPEANQFTTALTSVYHTQLPLTTGTTWSKSADLKLGRRNHAGCVQTDAQGKAVALLVGGGRGHTVPGQEGDMFSDIEALKLDGNGVLVDEQAEILLEMPRKRSSHHMVSLGDCLFVFGGRTEVEALTDESKTCDIYDFRTQRWKEGPLHPLAFAGGSSVVVANRYAWVFGGVVGVRFLKESWILDLDLWIQWISGGCQPDKRPETGWFKGPDLPTSMASPNICLAAQEDTGLTNDWILSVAPVNSGNFCFGLRLPPSKVSANKAAVWTAQGVRLRNVTYRMNWTRLGATPDGSALGKAFVARGSLVMIGGVSMIDSTACNAVHVRQLPSRGNILPTGLVEETPGGAGGGIMALLRGFGANMTANQKIKLNDHYLVGRLGFPIEEKDLFATDGTKKLTVKDPQKLHCQRCLVVTRSIDTARAHNDAALYAIRPQQMVSRAVSHRTVYLCSTCLCNMYYHNKT